MVDLGLGEDRRLLGELRLLRRAVQGRERTLAGGNDLRNRVEVARAHERLVLDGPIAVVPLQVELALLQPRIGQHALVAVGVGQLEHGHVQGMEAGQGDELELVAHGRQVALEGGDLLVVEQLLPVERRRAVVGQQLARVAGVDRFGEQAGLLQVGRRGLAPDQVGVGGVGQPAGDGLVQAVAHDVEPFHRPLAGEKRPVAADRCRW